MMDSNLDREFVTKRGFSLDVWGVRNCLCVEKNAFYLRGLSLSCCVPVRVSPAAAAACAFCSGPRLHGAETGAAAGCPLQHGGNL